LYNAHVSDQPVTRDPKSADAGGTLTVGSFIGALLAETAMGRSISDRASVEIAQQYLHHELLRGFSVPRMQIRDIEMDLNFAVAPRARSSSAFEDEEVRKHIAYRLRDFLASLSGLRDFSPYFRNDKELAARWASGLDEMTVRFRNILSRPVEDSASVVHSLSLSVQNYFYESAFGDLRLTVSSHLASPLRKAGKTVSMKAIIEREVRAIVASADRSAPEESSELPGNLGILVGPVQLEKVNPALLNKMKITVTPSDRRWVASDQDGKKVYILGT